MSMLDKLVDIGFIQRVENIPKVVSVRQSALWKFVREVKHEVRLFFGKRENLFDSKFIIDRYIDELDQLELEQFFLTAEDLLEEILIQHCLRRQIQLHCTERY